MRMKVSAMVRPISWAKAAATLISAMPSAVAMRGTRTVSAWPAQQGGLVWLADRAAQEGVQDRPGLGVAPGGDEVADERFGELVAGTWVSRVSVSMGSTGRLSAAFRAALAAEVVVDQGRVHLCRPGDRAEGGGGVSAGGEMGAAAARMVFLVRVGPGAVR